MNSMPEIIVNADDFGMSREVNAAIVRAFHDGLLTSTTVMANMPGLEEACAIASDSLTGKVGVHLNLTEGRPLTTPILRCERLSTADGMFRPRARLWRLTRLETEAVFLELQAQVRACIERGIVPSHMDSHHHIHAEWAVGSVVIEIARQYGIRGVRLIRNCGPGLGRARRAYNWAYNERLRRQGLARTRYFGSVMDIGSVLNSVGPFEAMVHPRPDPQGAVVDMEGEDLRRLVETIAVPPLHAVA